MEGVLSRLAYQTIVSPLRLVSGTLSPINCYVP